MYVHCQSGSRGWKRTTRKTNLSERPKRNFSTWLGLRSASGSPRFRQRVGQRKTFTAGAGVHRAVALLWQLAARLRPCETSRAISNTLQYSKHRAGPECSEMVICGLICETELKRHPSRHSNELFSSEQTKSRKAASSPEAGLRS